jgi:flavin-binding protein dodecin
MVTSFKLVRESEVSAANPNAHDLWLDEHGHLKIFGLDITDTVDYAEAVGQAIKCRLMMIRGEWYLDQNEGTPWIERIWVIGSNKEARLKAVFSAVIEGTPGVRTLSWIKVTAYDPVERQATIEFEVVAETGQRISSEELGAPFLVGLPMLRAA